VSIERLTSSSAISAKRSGDLLRGSAGGGTPAAAALSSMAAAVAAAIAAFAASCRGLLLLRRRGRVMNFGKGRASRSSATFVAACSACRGGRTDISASHTRNRQTRVTHLDQINDSSIILRLQQELLSLCSNSHDMFTLDIIGGETRFGVLKRVMSKE